MLIYATQSWLHLSLGYPNRWLRWSLVECALTSLFFIAGVPFGAKGVAIGYTVSYYLLFGPCLSYAAKPIGLKLQSIVAVVWRYFVAATGSGIISYFLFYRTDFLLTSHNVFLRAVSVSASCFLFYFALTALFYRSFRPMKQFLSTALQMIPLNRS
jgi:PST family polysaccharide transporter